MPYIKQHLRNQYDPYINDIAYALERNEWNVGDVTYVIYMIIVNWFLSNKRYSTIASIRGMLDGCRSEFDRQFAFPYEDEKIKENGDVEVENDT